MKKSTTQEGFSLIELMVAVAIMGIIASIAIPAYTTYVVESRRLDAHVTLRSAAQRLERCRTQQFSYAAPACALGPILSDEGYYVVVASNVTPNAYTLTASPTANAAIASTQRNDTNCQNITLDQAGSTLPAICWAP